MQYTQNFKDNVDFGPKPFATNITYAAENNPFYRRVLWTGNQLQVTLMNIPPCGEIGLEIHPDNDQFFRIEKGRGMVMMGAGRERVDFRWQVNEDDAIFVPAGTWHNLINVGTEPLKLYSIYAPPHHPHGTIHRTKEESDAIGD